MQAPYCGFCEKEQARLTLADLNNFSRFWGTGAVPDCLVPGPGVTSMVHSSLQREHRIREVVGVWT